MTFILSLKRKSGHLRRSPLKRKTRLKQRSHQPHKVRERCMDREWQARVCANGGCAKCGSAYKVTGHHLIPRRFKRFRHEVMNGIPLCAECHLYAHTLQAEFIAWLNTHRKEQWEWLEQHRNA